MVNNPQMVDLQRLTPNNFTAKTGIKVNYTVLPENDVRDKISQEFSSQAGQYDVASLSATSRSRSTRAASGSRPLNDNIAKDTAFDQADILKPMTAVDDQDDGKLYGEPFYGESSFLMYRKDVLDAKGVTMPEKPTWDRSRTSPPRSTARSRDEGHLPARSARLGPDLRPADHRGEHLRRHLVRRRTGSPGQRPEFTTATKFYIKLVRAHGEPGPPRPGSPSA